MWRTTDGMEILVWVTVSVMLFAAIAGWVTSIVLDRRDEAEHRERMKDPEYAKRWHKIHESDDWEDMGYFDGR